MLKPFVRCEICDEMLDVSAIPQLEAHILSHIPQVDPFDIFNYIGDNALDDRFEHRKEDIQKIVDELFWYGEFKDFDEFQNSDEWISPILEAAWAIMDELDDTWNWGEQEIAQDGKLRQAVSKIIHEYIAKITKDMLFTAVNAILVQLDCWRQSLNSNGENK